MTTPSLRRALAAAVLSLVAVLGSAAPAVADDDGSGPEPNEAIAVNTADGASVFRLALSLQWVTDGVVDQQNTAAALASCTDCQTVALAFQVVFVRGAASSVTPENVSVAYNDQCIECVTYASATQIVVGYEGSLHLGANGWRRLAEWYLSLRRLEDEAVDLSVVELDAAVQAAKAELIAILQEELEEIPPPDEGEERPDDPDSADPEPDGAASSSTTEPAETATSTTTDAGGGPTSSPPTGSTGSTAPASTSTTSTTTSTSTTTAPAGAGG